MREHIRQRRYHVELGPPRQDSEKLLENLEQFAQKYRRVLDSGYVAGITDNSMGLLAFQGHETIIELGLPVVPGQVMIHLNTFHTKENLHEILDTCIALGIRQLLVISGDGSDRLPRLQPHELGVTEVEAVTAVELIAYIHQTWPGVFEIGAAFNPYEPREHEMEKLRRKLDAGASFIITQPILKQNAMVDEVLARYPELPVFVEAWMSRRISLLSEAVGYEIKDDPNFDPIETLKQLHRAYPDCGVYLSLLGFKTQYHLLGDTWPEPDSHAGEEA
ncbi:MAG TPA: methylenetetrahydrofolate reductase [Clostridia bacterium]|nr:methylenetetrahydrofolate reductase [Clostridia bacterium]